MAKPSKSELPDKLKALFRARDKGKALYAAADELLDEVLAVLSPGDEVDLGGGKKALVVDNFAKGNKAWKPAGVNRFDVKLVEIA